MKMSYRLSLFVILATLSGIAFSASDPDRVFRARPTMVKTFQKMRSVYASEIAARGMPLTLKTKLFGAKDNARAEVIGGKMTISMNPTSSEYRSRRQIAVTLCHELGHHIGGSPIDQRDGMAFEGQADYFAFSKCLKRLWKNEDNRAALRGLEIDPRAEKLCSGVYSSEEQVALCVRSLYAAHELALQYFTDAGYTGEAIPDLDRRAEYKAARGPRSQADLYEGLSNPFHPSAQCRLDTMVAGALCDVDAELGFNNSDEFQGACAFGTPGGRPACWYVLGKHPAETHGSDD